MRNELKAYRCRAVVPSMILSYSTAWTFQEEDLEVRQCSGNVMVVRSPALRLLRLQMAHIKTPENAR